MEPDAVALRILDRVAECVAEVEQRALTRFSLVCAYDLRFDPAAFVNRMFKRMTIASHEARRIFFQPAEECGIANRAVFDHFRESRFELALRKRLQAIDVNQNRAWLPERADHVFAKRMVDPGLTPDRRIDLRKQRSGDLDERQTTKAHRRGESRK